MVSAQNPTVNFGDNLVSKGIPPIPASIAETVARYTQFRAASLANCHPNRREMLMFPKYI